MAEELAEQLKAKREEVVKTSAAMKFRVTQRSTSQKVTLATQTAKEKEELEVKLKAAEKEAQEKDNKKRDLAATAPEAVDEDIQLPKKQKVTNPALMPPKKKDGHRIAYENPGAKWTKASVEKMMLLKNLHNCLKAHDVSSQALSFGELGNVVFGGASEGDWKSRCFTFLVAVLLHHDQGL